MVQGRSFMVQNAFQHYTPTNGPTICRYKTKMLDAPPLYVEFRITIFGVKMTLCDSNHVKFTEFLQDSQFIQFISKTTDVYVRDSQTFWRIINAGKKVS